jgi:hypothetical protein|tara:strand:+ start:222 stop:731 length:510 start_codon:yes stop_codon:yes gene_type:complete
MTEKRGRGRPKGAPNKPKMTLITERQQLQNNADAYEILCQANIVAEKEPKLAVQGLQVFNDRNGAIKPLLQWAFDDNISSTLPEGRTPYGSNNAPASDLAETSLRFEHKQFKYFVTEQVPATKREALWIGLLEGIPKEEAEMLDLLKDGTWVFPNITKEIAKEAFPEIN